MTVSDELETAVLIVGGGPVGMALSLVLGRFEVPHVIVERSAATTQHPKARGMTGRTMELFRNWGIEQPVRDGGLRAGLDPEAASLAWSQTYCESGIGRVLGATNPESTVNSPSPKCCVAQDVVEQVLDARVRASPSATFMRETEMVSFENSLEGVTAELRDMRNGTKRTLRARYLAACDGADSQIRKETAIEVSGAGHLHNMASYFYRADLSYLPHAGRYQSMWIIPNDPGVPSGPILATGPSADRWLFLHYMADGELPLDDDALVAVVRAHWGIPDLGVELIGMVRWRMQALLAEQFRDRSVFLVGDAAHAIPPTGGLGLNTGIQDAHNLAWKLALVLSDRAADSLLDSYTTERQPFAAAVIEWAMENRERHLRASAAAARRDADPVEWRDALREVNRSFRSEGLATGYVYPDGALIPDGAARDPLDPASYTPSDRPGARFPHIWLDANRRESTLDWFDTELVLVVGPDADDWAAAGEGIAAESATPLLVRRLPWLAGPVSFEPDEALLVRPDGHVAWRSGPPCADPVASLREVLDSILWSVPGAVAVSDRVSAFGEDQR